MSDERDISAGSGSSEQVRRITRFDRRNDEYAARKLADQFHETTRWDTAKRWGQSLLAEYREWVRSKWLPTLWGLTGAVLFVVIIALVLFSSILADIGGPVAPGSIVTLGVFGQIVFVVPMMYAVPGGILGVSLVITLGHAVAPRFRQGLDRTVNTRISGWSDGDGVEVTLGTDEAGSVQSHLNASMGRSITTTEADFPDLLTALQKKSTEFDDNESVAVGFVTITPDEAGSIVMKPSDEQDHRAEVFGERATRTVRESRAPLAGFEARFVPIELSQNRIDAWRKRTDQGATRELLTSCRNDEGQFTVTVVAAAIGPASNAAVNTLLQDAESYFNRTPGVSAEAHTTSTDVAALRESPPELLQPDATWDDHRSMIDRLDSKRTPVVLKEAMVDFLPSETDKETGGLGDTGREAEFPTGPDDLDSSFLNDGE